jgi:dihydroorotase
MSFDRVLRGGPVIDPSQGIDAVSDVGFRGGRVAHVGAERDGCEEFLAILETNLEILPGL